MPPFFVCKTHALNAWVLHTKSRKPKGLRLAVSDMIRTRDLLIRSQTLYPAELHSHIRFEQKLFYNKRKGLSIVF